MSFTNLTLLAPWEPRCAHTSVIDAAGAIYVLGGNDFIRGPDYHDVWASTGEGVGPDSVGGYSKGALGGYSEGAWGYYGSTRWYKVVVHGYSVLER